MKKMQHSKKLFIAIFIFTIMIANTFFQPNDISSKIDLKTLALNAYAGEEDGEEEIISDPNDPPNSFIEWIIDAVKSVSGEQ